MRNPDRIKPFLEKFEKLWLKHPDLRFGQLVAILAHKLKVSDTFYIEDEEFEECIKKYKRTL